MSMAAPRNIVVDTGRLVTRGEEGKSMDMSSAAELDSPTAKRFREGKFPLSSWEFAAAFGVILVFSTGLFCLYLSMPAAEYGKLKLPRTISDLRILKYISGIFGTWGFEPGSFGNSLSTSSEVVARDNLGMYAEVYPTKFILGYCSTYIFMQTFMIPGTIFTSLLAGALFGVFKGLLLVVFNATAGASSCYFLSKLIGRPIVNWMWPEKLRFFQAEIAKRRDKLLNYMLFLRITPTLPNLFINLASPIVDIPFHIFFLATVIGLIPAAYITVKAGLTLGELKSVKDLYDFKTLSVLFLIGALIILPTILKRKGIYE